MSYMREMEKEKKSYFTTYNAKEIVTKFPLATLKITLYALRWIFLLILIYIIISITAMVYIQRTDFLIEIVGMGVGGFFAFFMGYFGWMFAQNIMELLTHVNEKKDKKD